MVKSVPGTTLRSTRTCLGERTGEIFIEKALAFVNACPRPGR